MKKLLLILFCLPFISFGQQSPTVSQDSLSINNVKGNFGLKAMCWDLNNSKYEVPKGSGKNSIFSHENWIGGIDDGGILRVAAQTYRQSGDDFWGGPVSDSVHHNDVTMSQWDKAWKISKQQIDSFILFMQNPSNFPNYIIPETIQNWPAHGDTILGQAYNLAPYIDVNSDGEYKYQDGDYPDIEGDEAIFFIKNDVGNTHTESNGKKIGLEMHYMIYAYNCENHPELNNTIFIKNTLFKRSPGILNDTYFGLWTDIDLGFYIDDYVGCNVPLNLGYGYNGDDNDEGFAGYGLNPPAQGVVMLNKSMDKFVYYNNDFTITGNPSQPKHYYNYLSGRWKDSTLISYGGNGYDTSQTAINCDYMFPGNSDTIGLGVGGSLNNPISMPIWSEDSLFNTPADRRMLMSHGPFDLNPLNPYILEYAFIFAWDSLDTQGGRSRNLLFDYTQNIKDFFNGNLSLNCSNTSGLENENINIKRKLIKVVDILGRKIVPKSNIPFIEIYDDGSIEKKIIIE